LNLAPGPTSWGRMRILSTMRSRLVILAIGAVLMAGPVSAGQAAKPATPAPMARMTRRDLMVDRILMRPQDVGPGARFNVSA